MTRRSETPNAGRTPPWSFHSPTELALTLITSAAPSRSTRATGVPTIVYADPSADHDVVDPLRGSFAEFARPSGVDLIARTAPIVPWIQARREARVWPYARAVHGGIGATTHAEGETLEVREGLLGEIDIFMGECSKTRWL